MKKILRGSLISMVAMISLTGAGTLQKPDVNVTVSGVEKADGAIYVSLCRKNEFLTNRCYRSTGKRVDGAASYDFAFEDVDAGRYAVAAVHDVNGNGQVDRNSYGAPTEPSGVSGKGLQAGAVPKFEDSAFNVSSKSVRIKVELR